MDRYEAEQLLKAYEEALFTKFRDWGDHPSQTEKIDLAVARLHEYIIKELTGPKIPINSVDDPLYPYGVYQEDTSPTMYYSEPIIYSGGR